MLEVLSSAKRSLIFRILGAGLSFLFNISIARLIGAEGAGIYFMAMSVTMISGYVGRLGLQNALLRFVARGANKEQWSEVHGVFRLSMRWSLIATSVLAILFATMAPLFGTFVFSEPAVVIPLRIMAVAIITLSMLILLSSALLGVKQVGRSVIVSAMIHPTVGLLVIWPFTYLFGPSGAAFAYLLGTTVASLAGFRLWQKAMRNKPAKGAWFSPNELWDSARPLWFTNVITNGFMPWGPLFFLAAFASAADVGLFGAASRVSLLLSFALKSVNSAVAPKYIELYMNKDLERLSRIARRFAGLFAIVTIPALLVLIFCGDVVMGMFGEEFRRGGQVLAILALGQTFSAISGSVLILLTMTGHEKDVSQTTSIAAVVVLIGCIILIPSLGIIGAAWAVTASVIVGNLIGAVKLRKRLGIVIFPIPGLKK